MTATKETDQLAVHLRKYSPSPSGDPDAGLRALTHYERRLPKWRLRLRQRLIPIVRWETPYLARMQQACRSPVLDSYFSLTANLGTHTFYMIFLPLCFWCGYPELGVTLIHTLALGVWWTGVIKDACCLPRPLSPPLARLTMSGSAALEYGFPSTHTANAVSVTLWSIHHLYETQEDWSPTSYRLLCFGLFCYATSITIGRMYCGMHGFFDIVVGALLGAFIGWLRVAFGPAFDTWIMQGDWQRPGVTMLMLFLGVRFHPEPADNCPCFDDSVSFIGVIIGGAVGFWHHAKITTTTAGRDAMFLQMYPYANEDLLKSAARLVLGVSIVFAWRAIMKPFLLRCLPPTFRFIDHWGLMISRRYFLQAGDYDLVPPLRKDDNILPSASEIPGMLSNLRNPRRRRVSIGPQSEADAREHLATREQTRKDGLNIQLRRSRPTLKTHDGQRDLGPVSDLAEESLNEAQHANAEGVSEASLQARDPNTSLLTPPSSDGGVSSHSSESDREEAKRDGRMFSLLEKPRTHYDVEVVTRLIVYAGIAWLAVEGNPVLFGQLGLN